jgi:molybdopterin synthase sulfur carrier subunit
MRIDVLYFAQLRDAMGDTEALTVESGFTVKQVVQMLRARPEWVSVEHIPLRYAVNETIVGADTQLEDGDVLALLPPVSGG